MNIANNTEERSGKKQKTNENSSQQGASNTQSLPGTLNAQNQPGTVIMQGQPGPLDDSERNYVEALDWDFEKIADDDDKLNAWVEAKSAYEIIKKFKGHRYVEFSTLKVMEKSFLVEVFGDNTALELTKMDGKGLIWDKPKESEKKFPQISDQKTFAIFGLPTKGRYSFGDLDMVEVARDRIGRYRNYCVGYILNKEEAEKIIKNLVIPRDKGTQIKMILCFVISMCSEAEAKDSTLCAQQFYNCF